MNSDITFTGEATATRTDAGKTDMGLTQSQFANNNPNFRTVTFNVTDGYQEITPIDVVVTITGHTSSVPYDGQPHTVTGYEATANTPLYNVNSDITFTGEATATRTNVVEGTDTDGKTEMGLAAGQFSNNNPNFRTVTFNVTDGYQEITPIDVTVTITGHFHSDVYDGQPHTVTGYDAEADNALYDVTKDFTFTGEATATRTNVIEGTDTDGKTDMGLSQDQFTNTNPNFRTVTFVITDGYQEITPATMTIGAVDYEDIYDGQSHEGGVTGDVPEGSVIVYSTDGGQTWSTEVPSITDVGTEDYIVMVTNSNYFDATAEGTLTVLLRPATVIADNKAKVYAEQDPELTATEEGLVEGESLDYTIYRERGENVGSYNITFTHPTPDSSVGGFFKVIMKVFQPHSETVVMGNYEVQFVDGEFDITPRPLTITAASDEKVYDGTPLTNSNYTSTALAEGDTLTSVTVTGSQTEVGSSPNTPSDAKITSAAGEDMTGNYDITYVKGALVVTPAPVNPPKPPKTGDDNHPWGWAGLAGLAMAGLAVLFATRKREEESR